MSTPDIAVSGNQRGFLFKALLTAGGVVLAVIATMVGMFLFGMYRLKQRGIPEDLLKNNPRFAMAKLQVTNNPDAVILNEDLKTGTIRYLDKKDGSVHIITVNLQTGALVLTDVPAIDPGSLKEPAPLVEQE